ncbi:FAD-linked oxidoreductase alt4 [Pseudocercospora fuligena]|uniref:FAD-linked oxidoreductase alt4 n=1 Tax=Pseudocercospora fuligena TaxID=685502 RepID=A0A8H6RQY0_9PEZI|nr:FAD-linked oxidoreductase alt4 [Pseudocercospora fuligena]
MAAFSELLVAELRLSLSEEAKLALPGSDDFDASNNRYTQYGRPVCMSVLLRDYVLIALQTYSVVVVPAREQDVVEVVKFCARNNVPFAPRSGHHCVTTSMRHLQNGLLIDMRSLNGAKLNLNGGAKEVTVGGGILTDDFVSFLQTNNLEVNVGSCPTTGLIGVAFGAGLGRLQGRYGYLNDNLISCRLVLADGSVAVVSKETNPDLFWAVRGAGHNFGVCTEATFRVFPQAHGGIHFSWDLEYSLEQSEYVLTTLNDVHSRMPPDLAIFLLWRRVSAGDRKNLILVNLVWSGIEEEAEPWIQEFERLKPIIHGGKVTTTWHDLPWETYGGQNKILSKPGVWQFRPWKMMSSVSVKNFDLKTTKAFFESIKYMNEKWAGKGFFGAMFECLPNHETRELPDNETAFPWRHGTDHFLMMTATPLNLDDREDFEGWLDMWKQKFIEVSGYGRLQQYVNYGNTTCTTEDPPEAMYGYEPWRLEKLRALKRRYDPDNVFCHYQPFM